MNPRYDDSVNRCQPGHGASCSLCCGSHNYLMDQEAIGNMLRNRGPREHPLKHPEAACTDKRFPEEMQCSHVGMHAGDPGLIGCLLYEGHNGGEEIESFITGTCRYFLCPAWHELTDRQIVFAARLMGDWYYYSLFINHLDAVHDLCATYGHPDDVPLDVLSDLRIELEERFEDEDGK